MTGDVRAFYQGLEVPRLPYATRVGGYRCLFLDVVSQGSGGPDFAQGRQQLAWLESELEEADHRLFTDLQNPAPVVAGRLTISACVFGANPAVACRYRINDGRWTPMHCRPAEWAAVREAPPGQFTLSVEAADGLGNINRDSIVIAAPGHHPPQRTADGCDADAIGEWRDRLLLSTRLGPNRNGRQW